MENDYFTRKNYPLQLKQILLILKKINWTELNWTDSETLTLIGWIVSNQGSWLASPCSESNVDCYEIPRNLKKIVKKFLVIYFADHNVHQH